VLADRDEIKGGAVSALRSALVQRAGVAGAVRACWYKHPLFASTLLTQSVQRRFAPDCDIRLITGFVSRIRSAQRSAAPGFPVREAEALIRVALGEVALLDEVDPSEFSYPEIGIAILIRLFAEWEPGRAEVDSLFQQAESVLQGTREVCPELGPGEEDWFAAGMHESPFAVLIDEASAERQEEDRCRD
jgi:hypothetical protein